MSETALPTPNDAETTQAVARPLSIETEVNGLAYVLEGQIPNEPDKFELVARLPDQTWEEVKSQIEEELAENDWFARQYHRTQQSLHLGDGRVGSVWVSSKSAPDGVPTVHVDRIQTELGYLPEDSEYHKAKGVGSMILDSLCAVADAKGWRITLYPLERDGRLMGTDLQDWYARRGFKFRFEEEDAEMKAQYRADDMLRFPQTPDSSSPIVQALAE